MAHIIADRVLETTTTTGVGPLTMAGAVTAHRTFGSVCANGDTAFYGAEGVDAAGAATGEWETGLGTWGTGGILTRTTVLASSNAGAAVNFSAGTKRVGIRVVAGMFPAGALVGDADAQSLALKTLLNPTVTNYAETQKTHAAGSSFNIDLAEGTVHIVPTNANATITLPAPVAGKSKSYMLKVVYGGAHTLTWAGGGTLKWAGGSAPTPTSVNGKADLFVFTSDGAETLGRSGGANF